MNRTILAIGGVVALAIAAVSTGCNSGTGSNQASGAAPATSSVQLESGESSISGGRYSTEFQGSRYTLTVPAGAWIANVKSDARVFAKDEGDIFAGLFVVGDVSDLSADACQWQGASLIPGPTVADLAVALTTVDGFEASDATEVSIAGYDGQHVRLTVPEDTDMAACDNGEYHGMGGFYAYEPGRVQDIWVVDLDGTRSVLFTIWDGNAPIAVQDEVAGLASSLEIEAAAP